MQVLQVTPPAGAPEGNLIGSMPGETVADIEKSQKFWRDVMGLQASGDHFACKFRRWKLPQRKKRVQAGGLQLCLAISTHIFEEEVPESDGIDLLADRTVASRAHASPIVFVRARPRQWDVPERQTCG